MGLNFGDLEYKKTYGGLKWHPDMVHSSNNIKKAPRCDWGIAVLLSHCTQGKLGSQLFVGSWKITDISSKKLRNISNFSWAHEQLRAELALCVVTQ